MSWGTQIYSPPHSRHPNGRLCLPQNGRSGRSLCLIFFTWSIGLCRRSIRRSTYERPIDHTACGEEQFRHSLAVYRCLSIQDSQMDSQAADLAAFVPFRLRAGPENEPVHGGTMNML